MANYEITWSCGHTEDKQLLGKMDARKSYIVWAGRSGICRACAANNEAAQIEATEQEHGLAPITGSAKQIAWARKIRAAQLAEVQEHAARLSAKVPDDKRDAFDAQRDTIMVAIASKAAASWWIDGRDDTAVGLIKRALKA